MQYLPGYEPTEQDMIEQALAMPLSKKVDKAIALLQSFEARALALDPRGYWVADSYGKDSSCIVELAKMAGVKHHCEHNLTTIDPPELIRFGRRDRAATNENRPKVSMLVKMVNGAKGPPTRLKRWCCALYKERGGRGKGKAIGVRIEESANRAALWRSVVPERKGLGMFVCPIVYWTEADVWAFHAERGLAYCELYDQGFKRLGCIGCPLAGPKQQAEEFRRWPRYEAMWFRGFERMYARWYGVPTRKGERRTIDDFKSAEDLWNWWRSGKAMEGEPMACQGEFLFSETEETTEETNDSI